VSYLTGVAAVATGGSHSLALKHDGTVWSWGYNLSGQLGLGYTSQTIRLTPSKVSNLTGVVSVSTSCGHNLALKSDGTIRAWGSNYSGKLGDGTVEDRSSPVLVSGLSEVVAIAAGGDHSLALKVDGTVWAWGDNRSGQLGDGTTTNRCSPVQVSGLPGVIAVASGEYHSLALKADGTVWSWGDNSSGQLGDGTWTNCIMPVQVSDLTDVVTIAAGFSHSLALKSDSTVWVWGDNFCGQLGVGTPFIWIYFVPVQVPDLTGVAKIAAGSDHSLAVKNDGTVWAWGHNNYGQLGDGTATKRTSTPVKVLGLNGVIDAAGGFSHSLFVGPPLPLKVSIRNAVSRKTHGSAGACDHDVRFAGTTESRKDGPTSLIILFDRNIQGLDGLDSSDIYLSSGTVTDLSIDFGRQLTVNLIGSTNGQPLTIAFPGIVAADDPTLTVTDSLCIGVLAGDVDGNNTVDSLDLSTVRKNLGQPLNASTCRYDVNADAMINSFDLTFTRARINSSLSATCP